MRNRTQKGFTLIELLVVIAIIGLLSTLAVVALNSARQKSRDSKRVSDVKQVQTALELYFADKNEYPAAATAVELGVEAQHKALCTGGFSDACTSGQTVYMGLVPETATPADGTCGADNKYMYTSDGTTYDLAFCLGGAVGGLPLGVHHATPNGIK